MVAALASKGGKPRKRLKVTVGELKTNFKEKSLHDFVSANTMILFERFDISTDFLSVDPCEWPKREDFQRGIQTCKAITVVNDSAERGVKLFTDYNEILSIGEEEKQFIIKVVQDYRGKYTSHRKSDLISNLFSVILE